MIYFTLFWTFFKIGLFTFGGGYAMIPLIQSEVLAHKWMALEDLVNFIAVSESTPGPFAINISTYIGAEMGGFFGSVCATFGVVLPSFVIILIVAKIYDKFRQSKIVSGCMTGLKPAVIGLIGAAVISVGINVFFHDGFTLDVFRTVPFYVSLVLFLGMLFLIMKKKLHPIVIICISAAVGIAAGYALNLPV